LVVAGGSPSIYIGLVHERSVEVMEVREWGLTNLTVDELEISWALSITVSHAILCTGLVGWELRHAPSATIPDRYSAPFNPQGRCETSTSNVNSWFSILNI